VPSKIGFAGKPAPMRFIANDASIPVPPATK
jgi:hypothetical protein